jgi:hypothetical protein
VRSCGRYYELYFRAGGFTTEYHNRRIQLPGPFTHARDAEMMLWNE